MDEESLFRSLVYSTEAFFISRVTLLEILLSNAASSDSLLAPVLPLVSETSRGCSAFVIAHATGRRFNHAFHDSSNALDYALVQVAPPKQQAGSGPSTLGWDVSETSQRPGTQRSATCRQPRAAGWQVCAEATAGLNVHDLLACRTDICGDRASG